MSQNNSKFLSQHKISLRQKFKLSGALLILEKYNCKGTQSQTELKLGDLY